MSYRLTNRRNTRALGRVGVRVTVIALVMSVIPGIMDPSGVAPAAADEGQPAPGLESPPVGLNSDPLSDPIGDFSQPLDFEGKLKALPDDPAIPGGPVQPGTVIARTSSSTTYDNGNGTSTVRLHRGLVNFRDDAGVWRAIDTRLTEAEPSGFKVALAPFEVQVGDSTEAGQTLLSVADDDWKIGFKPVGLTAGRSGEVNGGTIRYPEVGSGTDLVLKVGVDRVKEVLRLNRPLPLGQVPRWRSELVLDNATPRVGSDGDIEFVGDHGDVVARIPLGIATDSSRRIDARGLTPRTLVRPLLLPTDTGWAVELIVDASWLNDPARVYPIFVDPTIIVEEQWEVGRDLPGADVVVGSGCGNCTYDGDGNFTQNGQTEEDFYVNKIGRETYTPPGTNATGEWEWRSLLFYELEPIKDHQVVSATFVPTYVDASTYPADFNLRPIANEWNAHTVAWTTPGLPANRAGQVIAATVPCDGCGANTDVDITAWMQNWLSRTWPSWGMTLETPANHLVRMSAMEEGAYGPFDPYIDVVIENEVPYIDRDQLTPVHRSTVITPQPTLSAPVVNDPEGDAVQYWFRLATGPDGISGTITNSGWLNSPTFTVPKGALCDGVTYYWRVYTRDAFGPSTPEPATWGVAELTVDQRLGTGGPSPFDSVGPVSVNLATGNATVSVAAPSFAAVGGNIGVGLTYNSAAVDTAGLLATYVDDADPANALVRRDARIWSYWDPGSPGAGIPNNDWTVTWTGYVRVPVSGYWYFGYNLDSFNDDGTIWAGSPLAVVADSSGFRGETGARYKTKVWLDVDQRLPIKVRYHQGSYSPPWHHLAWIELWAMREGDGYERDVRADWLSTEASPLPDRWTISAGPAELAYSHATLTDNSLVLVDTGGGTHQYVKQPDAGWRPTNVEDDIVSSITENGEPRLVVDGADGLTYAFDGVGRLRSVRTALDQNAPAAAEYQYDASSRLTSIKDPLSSREIQFTYGGGSGDCEATGFTAPRPGMLCKLTRPDGGKTKLLYNSNHQLARVETRGVVPAGQGDPGPEVTDFAYDGAGRLATVRHPLAYDAVSAANPWPDNDTTRTLIAYHASGDATGKVQSITAPIAQRNDTDRLAHSYDYGGYSYSTASETRLNVAGIVPPEGRNFARKVTFDTGGRALTDTGLDNLTSSQQWEPWVDRLLSSTDKTGRMTTTFYDHAGRPTDSYGPAPASWFHPGTRLPTGPDAAKVPRAVTAYDEGMRGLSAKFWANENLSGVPKVQTLGIGNNAGDIWADWDLGAPTGLGVVDNFSGRFTGEIRFPAAGYRLDACADDGVRVWIDDVRWIDRWGSVGCTTGFQASWDTQPHRIRIEFREATGNADVGLHWIAPGGTRSVVPGANLAPRYGLVTSTTDPDGKKTATRYASPELGLATATVVDPDDLVVNGANVPGERLTTELQYEQPGAGYRRRVGRRTPAYAYNSFVRGDNAAAHWRFEENTGATTAADDSGNGRSATYPQNATRGAQGVGGSDNSVGLYYEGVSAGDVFDFPGTSNFSVEAWVNPDVNGTGWQRILSKETTDANGRQGWLLWLHNNTFGFERFRDGSGDFVSGGATRPGKWTHVVATYSGTEMRLYVDGTLVGAVTPAPTESLLDTTVPLYVGDGFHGRVDEAAVYSYKLQPWEVTDHWRAANYYARHTAFDSQGGYWRLAEQSGVTTALDSSGNNRHATYATSGVTMGVPGPITPDNAVSTDGGPIADAGDVLDFAGTPHFSLEAWVKLSDTLSDSDTVERRILSKEGTDANGRQGYAVWTKGTTLGFERVRDGTSSKIQGGTLTKGRWHHVLARWNGSLKIFLDGVEVATGSSSLALVDHAGTLKIGDGFKGSMTHAVVYTSAPGTGAIKRHYRDGIAQRVAGTVHYLPTETRTNPCPSGGSAVQSGLPKLTAEQDPDFTGGNVGRLEETVYDVLGRVVASLVNDEAWSCTTYDARGRVKSTSSPAFGGQPARTTTYDHAVGGDPLKASVTDVSGSTTTTVTSTVDLLGRLRSHTDTWGKTTTTTYDQAGRVTATNGPGGQMDTDYRSNGWVDAQRLGGKVVARPSYNAVGELDGVTYPAASSTDRGNGTSIAVLRDEASGRTRNLTSSFVGGATAADEVVYSVGGRVKDELIDGVDARAGGDNFVYDGAGRLVNAWVPGHTLTYAFANDNSCGQSWTAGRNTNRTSATDNGTTYTYCYDNGDKLTSTNDARYFSIAHDSRNNVTTLGDDLLTYDGANRHVKTTKTTTTTSGGTTTTAITGSVQYVRDGLDRIVERRVDNSVVARYAHGGPGDAPVAVLSADGGTVVETTVPLIGGVVLTTRAGGDVWSYPNVHGDVMATADAAGAKVGATLTYDPYGQALGGLPDNSMGDFDYGWLGRHQKPVETGAAIDVVEMGARPYVPGLGRFLEVDPVEGGGANDFEYCYGDPVNCTDLDGTYGYSHTYSLGLLGLSASQLLRWVVNNFHVFPVSGCGSTLTRGEVCGLRFFGTNPIQVTGLAATSFTFLSLAKHKEGGNKTITFSFSVRRGRAYLTVRAGGKNNWWQQLPLANRANRAYTRNLWQTFADNIVANLHWQANDGAGGMTA